MNHKTQEFLDILSEDNAKSLAQYIIDIVGIEGELPNPVKSLEYDFKISD